MATTRPRPSLPYHCPKCGVVKEFQNLLTLREHLSNDHSFSDFFDSTSSLRPGITSKRSLPNFNDKSAARHVHQSPLPVSYKAETYVPNLLRKLSNVAEELEQQLLLARSLNNKQKGYTSNLKKLSVGIHQFDVGYPDSLADLHNVTHRNSRRSPRTSPYGSLVNSQTLDGFHKQTPTSLSEIGGRDETDSLILSAALRKVQDELEVKEEELKSSKGELAKVTLEKLQLNENSVTLANELDASKAKVTHLQTEIDDKENLIQEKERNLRKMNDFLERTSEKQATAKEQLRVFMDSVLDRAERAENDLHTLTSMRNTPVGSMLMQPSEVTPVNGSASLSMNGRPREQVSSASSSSNEMQSTRNQPHNGTPDYGRHPFHDRFKRQRSLGRYPSHGRTSTGNSLGGHVHPLTRTPEHPLSNGINPSQSIRSNHPSAYSSLPHQRTSTVRNADVLGEPIQTNGIEIHRAAGNPSPLYHTLERAGSPISPRSCLIRNHERHPDVYSDSAIGSSGNGSRITNSEFAITQMSPHTLPQQASNPFQYSKPELSSMRNDGHDHANPAFRSSHIPSKRCQRHVPIHEAVVERESASSEMQSMPHNGRDPISGDDYERVEHNLPVTRYDSHRADLPSLRNGSAMTDDHLDLELFRSAVEDVLHQRDIQSRTSLYSPPGVDSQSLYADLQSPRVDRLSEGQSSGYDDSYGDDSLDELPVKDQSSGFKDCPKQRKTALFCVFSYLETESLLTCAQVCKEWGQVSRHPALWKKVHLSRHMISSKFLQTLSKWCTQTEHLTLESLRPRVIRKGERSQDYMRKTRGTLEAGLEYILQASGSSLLTLRIYDCCNILTDRSLWLASCHCRFLETVMYVSDTDPIGHEVIWALGAGCRNIRALQIPPMFPCKNTQKFNNKCVQMIGRCWPLIQGLCIGGDEVDVRGLVSVVKNCPRLYVLELDHMMEVTEETAVAMCSHGLRGLETLIFTATPVTPKAILHFNSACPQLKVIAVYVGISDYFDDITNGENQREFKGIASRLKMLKKKPALMDILHLKTNC